jgi:hypothetical protein
MHSNSNKRYSSWSWSTDGVQPWVGSSVTLSANFAYSNSNYCWNASCATWNALGLPLFKFQKKRIGMYMVWYAKNFKGLLKIKGRV